VNDAPDGRRTSERTPLGEIARVFLKLGTIAFGGPAAHIAMMEDEVVRRRGWLSRDAFLDYVGATNLIPGPNSTELAIHIGHARGGWPGLLLAGACFILPATLIVSAVAWAYVRYGTLPDVSSVLYGIKPVIIAVVLHALWRLGQSALKTIRLVLLAIGCAIAVAAGVHELLVLAVAAVLWALGTLTSRHRDAGSSLAIIPSLPTVFSFGIATGAAAAFTLSHLFWVCLKIGAVLFGSGYVLLAFLRADFVDRLGWLTETQLLDAVAVGQFTPGPVFTTATFIGYLLGGAAGAVVATVGIFLPAFFFVAVSGPLIPRIRSSRTAGAVLDAVNVASLALMAVVTWHLAAASLVDLVSVMLLALSLILLVRFGVNSAWLVLAGGVVGWLSVQGFAWL
jgi:chromate transporter